MKITVKNGDVENAPKGFVHVSFTVQSNGTKRFTQRDGVEVLEIGAGEIGEMTVRKFRILCRSVITVAKANKIKKVSVQFDRLQKFYDPQLVAENFEMANFDFNIFKTKPEDGWDSVEEIYLAVKPPSNLIEKAVKKGQEIGRAVNACRTLANMPGGDMTPTLLAKAAKDAVKGLPVSVRTIGAKEMKKLGMGAILGVAKGSTEAPTFTIMEYKGARSSPIVLAGKGVTFDSGGLNLKPTNSIYEMHMDMSGAAAAMYSIALVAKLKLKKHVIALLPSVENMPGNNAVRPGDILKSLSGKTIEVTDTDAEGRLILADALTYAKRFKPSVVVDIATLTGAAHVALGDHASALMTRDDALAEQLSRDGESSGDYVWRLPLWDEYEEKVKGTFADVANIALGPSSRHGGAIDGGMFLWQFAKELSCPWAHLDIAPRMTSVPSDELAKGAIGTPIRLLTRFIEQWNP